MKENILSFVNKLESFKTAIKNLHWSSSNMSEHKLFDEIAESVAEIQDEVSEMEQGLHGQIEKNKLKPQKYNISTSKQFLVDLLNASKEFYKTIDGDDYIGIRSSMEAFIGEVNKFQYLLNLCLKEDLQRRIGNKLNERKTNNKIMINEARLDSIISEVLREANSSIYDIERSERNKKHKEQRNNTPQYKKYKKAKDEKDKKAKAARQKQKEEDEKEKLPEWMR